jgi:hypothetical protein
MQQRAAGVTGVGRCVYCHRLGAQVSDPFPSSRRQSHPIARGGRQRRCDQLIGHAAAPEQQAEPVASTSQPEAEAEHSRARRASGRQTYRPASFGELVNDATSAIRAAVEDGLTRLEVEFPPLPGNIDGALWDPLKACMRLPVTVCPCHAESMLALESSLACRLQGVLRLVRGLQHPAGHCSIAHGAL